MQCNVSDPPSIELADPSLALRRSGDTYVQEWAIYPFFSAGRGAGKASQPQEGCTDFYCFVNAQRHDMGSSRLPMQRTGFLGPDDSRSCDLTTYEAGQRMWYTA